MYGRMINVMIPEDKKRRLPFYLACEEWVARNLPADEYFFAWRVAPTVICGRNQVIANEVDMEFCGQNGIDVVRRKSGGGCVYADMNNYMFSYITTSTAVAPTFGRYTGLIVGLLDTLGVKAHANGRNDIFVGDCKIAGNAFYRLWNRAIVHGTLLVDIDSYTITHAITPSRSKMEAHGVASTASHVTSLHALGVNISPAEFGRYAVEILCRDDKVELTPGQIIEVEEIERSYYHPSFLADHAKIRQHTSARTIYRRMRFDDAGEFHAYIRLDNNGTITGIDLLGDYFALDDIRALITEPLEGLPYSKAALLPYISNLPVQRVICNMNPDRLAQLLI